MAVPHQELCSSGGHRARRSPLPSPRYASGSVRDGPFRQAGCASARKPAPAKRWGPFFKYPLTSQAASVILDLQYSSFPCAGCGCGPRGSVWSLRRGARCGGWVGGLPAPARVPGPLARLATRLPGVSRSAARSPRPGRAFRPCGGVSCPAGPPAAPCAVLASRPGEEPPFCGGSRFSGGGVIFDTIGLAPAGRRACEPYSSPVPPGT